MALSQPSATLCHTSAQLVLIIDQQLCAVLQDLCLLSYALRLRYSDFNKVDKIISNITAFLESHSGVDHKLPHKAELTDLATYGVDISIIVSIASSYLLDCSSVYLFFQCFDIMPHWHMAFAGR